jgi:hypothetical protein
MEDIVQSAGLDTARARARWFLVPAVFWMLIGIVVQRGDLRVLLAFALISLPFLTLWYFASQGKAWAFFVGVVLNVLSTVASMFTGQIIGVGISGFVTYRLWVAFLDCAALETATRAHAEAASHFVIPSHVSMLIPAGSSGARLPARIADEEDGPSAAPWKPYSPPPPDAAAPKK